MITRIARLLGWVDPEKRQIAINEAMRAAFATENGRIAMAEILRMARVHQAPAHPSRDARTDAFMEGRRALAIAILARAGFDPDRLPEALIADRLEEMTDDRRTRPGGSGDASRSGGPGPSRPYDPDLSLGD